MARRSSSFSRHWRRWAWLGAVCGGATVLTAAGPGPAAPPTLQRLDPLVVTGTRTAQRLSETPIRTEVLQAQDLRFSGGACFADALELLPGARVENNCQNCGTSEVLLLGLEQKYTQVLFDGAPLFSGLAGVYGIEQIPTLFLERIEVVKGGGSAIYGSGAVGGVINLIGRRPERTGGVAEVRFESVKGQPARTFSLVADAVGRGGRTAVSVYGQRARTADVDLNADGFSDLTRRKLDVAGLRLLHRAPAGVLRFDFSRTEEFRRGGNKLEQPEPLADIAERVWTRRDAGSLVWEGTPGGAWDYQAAVSVAAIERGTYYGGLFGRAPEEPLLGESATGAGDNDQPFLDRGYQTAGEVAQDQFGFTRNRVASADLQINRRWDSHQTTIGAQHYRETIDDWVPVSPFVADFPAPRDVARGRTTGVFVQDDWRLNERWRIVLGLRGDRDSELPRPVLSPRMNVKWRANDELTLRATYGTGFRAPQPFDEDLHVELIAGDRTRTVQAPDLRAEKSRSALLSAEYSPDAAGGRLALEATAFLTRIRGTFTNSEVQPDPVTGEAVRRRYNGPDAEVGGLEFNLGCLPRPDLRLDLGYVAQVARFAEPVTIFDDGAGGVVRERAFLETPRHYGVAQATWLAPKWADLAVQATYTGRMKDINQRTGELNARTRDFLVWNASLSRQFSSGGRTTTITLGGRNLFDSRQRDLERGADRDPYYLYGPRVPRSWYVAARLDY